MATVLSACGEDENDDDDSAAGAGQPEAAETSGDDDFANMDANGDSYLDADEVAEWQDDAGVFTA